MQLVSSAQLLKAGLMSFTSTYLQKPLLGILVNSILYLVALFRKVIKQTEWQIFEYKWGVGVKQSPVFWLGAGYEFCWGQSNILKKRNQHLWWTWDLNIYIEMQLRQAEHWEREGIDPPGHLFPTQPWPHHCFSTHSPYFLPKGVFLNKTKTNHLRFSNLLLIIIFWMLK